MNETPIEEPREPEIDLIDLCRLCREKLKWSQPFWGEVIGVSPKTVSRWELEGMVPKGLPCKLVEVITEAIDLTGESKVKARLLLGVHELVFYALTGFFRGEHMPPELEFKNAARKARTKRAR